MIEIEEGKKEAPEGHRQARGRVLEAKNQHNRRTGVHRKLAEEAIAAVVLWNPLILAGGPHHKIDRGLSDLAHRAVA